MIHPYQLHSLSKIYHEQALKEAQVRHLASRAKAPRGPRSEQQGLWSRLGKQVAAVRLW
ncbi:MAG TPA: hypothetical protein VFY54_14850 [Rubrobacter sp.]|jgi:hypothetical protein|nr:hypothetical protein [Rubrobacter sp.]